MTLLLTVIAFLLLLSLLIFIHELGHFYAARKFGIVVEEFGIGIPPRALTLFERRGTRFSLNWIPFGGFVRLQGESTTDLVERSRPGSFASAPLLSRMVVLSAGVLMNFFLAILLFAVGFSLAGWVPWSLTEAEGQRLIEEGRMVVDRVMLIEGFVEGGNAAQSGLPAGTILRQVDGQAVSTYEQVKALQAGKNSVQYVVSDPTEEDRLYTAVIPLTDHQAGVILKEVQTVVQGPHWPVSQSVQWALRESWFLTSSTIQGMGFLFTTLLQTATIPEGISGPIGIAQLTYESVQAGFWTYVRLMAVISLSLAVLNILPFPPLDGGRLLFLVLELIARRPLNRRVELVTNEIGFVFLLMLILLITFNDILRLF